MVHLVSTMTTPSQGKSPLRMARSGHDGTLVIYHIRRSMSTTPRRSPPLRGGEPRIRPIAARFASPLSPTFSPLAGRKGFARQGRRGSAWADRMPRPLATREAQEAPEGDQRKSAWVRIYMRLRAYE